MKNKVKNIIYRVILRSAKTYWKFVKPKTSGARIIVISQEHILLVQHRNSKYWTLPGGGIKKNEDPARGALRELYEETKIKIDSADYQLGRYDTSAEGKRDEVFIVVKETAEKIEPKVSFELHDARWFDVHDLPEHTSPATRLRIREYQKGLRDIDEVW